MDASEGAKNRILTEQFLNLLSNMLIYSGAAQNIN